MTVVASKHYVDEIGTEILLNAKTDLTDSILIEMAVLKPGATNEELWDAVVTNTTEIQHFTEAGDWHIDGDYKYQIIYHSPVGAWRGETYTRKIYPKFG